MKINSFSNIFYLSRKNLPCFKRKQEKFREKHSWIRSFGIRENMLYVLVSILIMTVLKMARQIEYN